MDRTPSEIWTDIFAYACTDSGTTGRQLSLVSKFIQEASAPVKLQSIAVHGHQQILAFHELLLKTPPHLRQIRYLFLSTAPLPARSGLTSISPSRTIPQREYREEADKLRNACECALVAVAECVEILYLDAPLDHLWNVPFPKLAELTSTGFPVVPTTHASPDPNSILCPELRRWHLLKYPWLSRAGGVFTAMHITAPAITHLRISGLQQELSFVRDLKAGLPETIQHVYVKPNAPIKPGGRCGTGRARYGQLMRELEILNHTDTRLVLLPKYNADEVVGTCAMSDWQERINGADGCWSLRERVLVDKCLPESE